MTNNFDKIQENFYTVAEYKRFYWQTENIYIQKKELELLLPIVKKLNPNDKILEVGCGEGANITNLRKLGINNHITASDLFDSKVDFLNTLHIPNCDFIKADVRSLPFNDESFDIVFIRDLLHHVNFNRPEALKELLRVTKPGGKLFICEANPSTPANFVFALAFSHERGMLDSSKKKLSELLKPYKYKIESMEPNNFFRILLHYSFGIPKLANYKIITSFLDFINSASQVLIPKKFWSYWFVEIDKI